MRRITATIGGQDFALTCGKGLQAYVEARTLAGDITPEGFREDIQGVAVCDILTIATEGSYADLDWVEIFISADTTDHTRTQMVEAATLALTATIPAEEIIPPVTTDFSAPGMPVVGSEAWHRMVRGS